MQDIIINSTILLSISYTGYHYYNNTEMRIPFLLYLFCSMLTYKFVTRLIPHIKQYTLKAGLKGKDINKKGTPQGEIEIPETLGLVPATIFILFSMIGILYVKIQSENLVLEHTAGILSILFCTFLGFCDDVFDLPWRYKMFLPNLACLPILVAYKGVTHVVVPIQLRVYLGDYIDLGLLYFLYMMAVATFCTNSINIYAGINGLEVSQSLIIACCILVHNVIEMEIDNKNSIARHVSVILILPYIFSTLGLYKFNKYPSQVFVGDTFCYWSGMVFATVGILGHFSKTLLLFFIPQIINFVYSLPQLLKIIPCPRHRLPYYDKESGKLVKIKSHLNLINLYLWIRGPLSEKRLCLELVILQIFCSFFGFFVRYYIAHLIF